MAQLLVRDLDDEVVHALKISAAANGRSIETEHREILRAHLIKHPKNRSFKEVLAGMPYFDDDDLFDY